MSWKEAGRVWGLGLLLLISFPGCMDDGFDGYVPPTEVFVDEWGCLSQEPRTYGARLGFDVDRLEASLQMFRGAADLVLGAGEAPANYFSVGRGPGTQKLRVGPGSQVPVQAGTWYLVVGGSSSAATGCDPERPAEDPDWHLVMRRTPAAGGVALATESCRSPDCAVPACNAYPCPFRDVPLDVPADASSLEVVLNSLDGDADLSVVAPLGVQLGASANPGAGYDIVVLGPDRVETLREQTLSVRLTSWARPTDQYDLQATYRP